MHVEQTILPNGLRVVTSCLPGFQSAAVVVFVQTGARAETEANGGTAHFLEHLAFKGTQSRTALQIATEIECLGAHVNAFTSKEMTAYYVSGLNRTVPEAVAILGDVLTASRYAEEDIALERQVVLQEIRQYQDNPGAVAHQALWAEAFPDQPLGRPILGSAEFIGRIARNDVTAFVGQHYFAENMVVVGTGEIDHTQFCNLVSQHFAALPHGRVAEAPAPARYVGGVCRDDSERFKQVTVLMGLDAVPDTDPRSNAFGLLSSVLGGGLSSPLFQEVRQKRGLAYSVSASCDRGADFGLFTIHAGTTAEHVPELLRVICTELRRTAEAIAPQDFARARNQALARLATTMENPFRVARTIAWGLFTHGRVITPDTLAAEVEAIVPGELVAAAQHILASRPSLALVGPVPEAVDAETLQGLLAAG